MRRAVRMVLRLYPSWFRERYGAEFVAAAERRWSRERSERGAVRAYVRTVAHLVADAAISARSVWKQERPAPGLDAANPGGRGIRSGDWLADLRVGAVSLVRRPGFTALVVLTLGLGLGVSAAVFGALDRVILRPLPYANGDRMAYVSIALRDRGWELAPPQGVVDRWRSGSRTVERLEVYRSLSAVRTEDGRAELVQVLGISGGLPSMLGVRPLAGRMLGPLDGEADASPAVMLSERFWRGAFGSEPSALAGAITLNDTVFAIAGVWPESARLDPDGPPQVIRVLPADAESPPGEFAMVLALLRKGVSAADVESELAGLLQDYAEEGPLGASFEEGTAVPAVRPPYGYLPGDFVRGLWLVFAGGLVLMFVAIVNAVNLILGRVEARTGEIGIRLALGGSRTRLARLFLSESALLSMAGVAIGLLIAFGVGRGLAALQPAGPNPALPTGLEGRAFGFAALLAGLAALVCGLVPLVPARRAGVRGMLAGSGEPRHTRVRSPLRSALIGSEAALAVLLVVGAMLLVRSFVGLLHVDTGMALNELVEVSLRVPAERVATPEAHRAVRQRIQDALAAIPGVTGVTTSSNPPLRFSIQMAIPALEGEPEPADSGGFTSVTSAPDGFFDVLGIPIREGRAFEPGEKGAVIVNEAFARRHRGDVVGRILYFPGDTLRRTVVGIAGDVRSFGLRDDDDRIQLYHADSEGTNDYMRFLLRAEAAPGTVLAAARATLASLEPGVPLREATTGRAMLREQTAQSRFVAMLLVLFSALALLFAIGGVYGAVALDVKRRSREMGIRSALGATGRELAGLVVATGMRPVLAGAAVGVIAALWAGPLVEATLFGVEARDPLSVLAAVLLLAATTGIGALVPGLRAARADPDRVLRAE